MSVPKVNLDEKFRQFDEQWSPKIAGEVNDADDFGRRAECDDEQGVRFGLRQAR